MALLRPSLDYTDLDFDALRSRARQLISAAFPEWTDDNVADFGNILVDLICFMGDVFGFYQNKQALETRWTRAKLRKSLLSLVKLTGYIPGGASAATAVETFTLAAAMPAPLVVPKGTKVSTLAVTEPTSYQLVEDLIILAGQTQAQATVEHSEFQTDRFTSSGGANQSFTLTRTPYLPDSLQISAADGVYTQVSNLLGSSPTDRHFFVVVDQNDRARVDFGNGINGAIPSGTIDAFYKTGGGAVGRVEAGALRKLEGSFADENGNLAAITVTNVLKSTGGFDRQTNGSIKVLAPLSVRVANRTVGRDDYEIVAYDKAPNLVARALMLTKNQDASIAENAGILFLVPPDAGTVPQSTVDLVTAGFVEKPYAPTFSLAIQGASYLVVNVTARIYLANGAVAATVKAAAVAALGEFFAPTITDEDDEDFGAPNPLINFGWHMKDVDGNPAGSLALTDVQNVVRDTIGIRKLEAGANGFLLNGANADLPILDRQFPKLGTVTLINADSGATL